MKEGKTAFTLAEVLISFGIIIIVLLITIPGFLQKYTEKATVAKVKNINSLLNQIYLSYKTDKSKFRHLKNNSGSAYIFFNKFKNNLKINNDCGTKVQYKGENCYHSFNINSQEYYMVLFKDGSFLTFQDSTSDKDSLFEIVYDVNGNGFPNKFGKDLFKFGIKADNTVIEPYGSGKDLKKECIEKLDTNRGWSCTAWVVYNENMDYLHCDDLSWDGKHKCSD